MFLGSWLIFEHRPQSQAAYADIHIGNSSLLLDVITLLGLCKARSLQIAEFLAIALIQLRKGIGLVCTKLQGAGIAAVAFFAGGTVREGRSRHIGVIRQAVLNRKLLILAKIHELGLLLV